MRKRFIYLIITVLAFCIFTDALAKRFGGGRSFGFSRSATSYSRTLGTPLMNRNSTFSPLRRWLAPMLGLALGGLLATLLMSNGMGSGILTWLLILSAVYLLFQLIRRKAVTVPDQASLNSFKRDAHDTWQANQPSFTNSYTDNLFPFNEEDFLRQAKVQFIRLQAAYDSKNFNDLREFTTPEVFAEISLQLNERAAQNNITEVVSLDTEFLGTQRLPDKNIASVRFFGLIKEEPGEEAQSFTEVWHFQQDQQQVWRVAGLEQQGAK